MSGNVKNMTSGSPGKLILFFALPLMAGNVFQQFYTMVDAMVVGQIVGVKLWPQWELPTGSSGWSRGLFQAAPRDFPY